MNSSFKPFFVDHDRTCEFSSLIAKYLNGDESIRGFYRHTPEINSFFEAIDERKKVPVNRKLLVETLLHQYRSIDDKTMPSLRQRIMKLEDENTFTVTTGHQLCLFTGPLYFIYKIVSAINLAEALQKKYTGYTFIPVYWMASEDHDFDEINHLHLFSQKLTWLQDGGGPAGKRSTEGLKSFYEQLSQVLGTSEEAVSLLELFRESYLNHTNMADATRYLVHKLFGAHGLVVLDADDHKLKREFLPVMKEELLQQRSFKLVNDTNKELSSHTKIQVTPREINLFYAEPGLRERITGTPDGNFSLLGSGRIFTKEALPDLLEKEPEKFSPNVVLRPLYQETILPNLAYIGGPGEITYWLQFKALFDFYHVPFPVLVLRNCLTWLDKETVKKLHGFGFSTMDIFKDTDTLVSEFLTNNSSVNEELNLEEEKEKLKQVYESLKSRIETLDPTLLAFISGEQQKASNAILVLEQKLRKAEKKKYEGSVNQIKALKEKLFPGQVPQERHFNFAMLYLRYGDRFMQTLFENLDPLRLQYLVIREEE